MFRLGFPSNMRDWAADDGLNPPIGRMKAAALEGPRGMGAGDSVRTLLAEAGPDAANDVVRGGRRLPDPELVEEESP